MSTFIPAYGYATTRDDSVPRYKRSTRRRIGGLVIVGILIVTALLFDCHTGPSGLPVSTLLRAVFHQGSVATDIDVIVWQIRLAVMALLVGAALGLSGAEVQTILNNPLASPYTLGISAAFGVSLAIVLNITIPGVAQAWVISANAFAFALLSAFLLDTVAR